MNNSLTYIGCICGTCVGGARVKNMVNAGWLGYGISLWDVDTYIPITSSCNQIFTYRFHFYLFYEGFWVIEIRGIEVWLYKQF